MYGMRIFLHRELMTALNQVLWQSRPGLRVREVLDQRLNLLGLRGTLRRGSNSYRIQKTMFSDDNMRVTQSVLFFVTTRVWSRKCNDSRNRPNYFGHLNYERTTDDHNITWWPRIENTRQSRCVKYLIDITDDSLTLVIVRWFETHPTVTERERLLSQLPNVSCSVRYCKPYTVTIWCM